MSSVSFNRKKAKLKQLLGIRARLALLALILVTPLMLERARSLEDTRSRQVALASAEFANLAKHSADAQQEVISSVETLLKSAAYIRASAGGIGRSCDLLRASVPANLPWIRSLSIVGKDGRIQCSTLNILVGINLSDRAYFKKAQQTGDFVFSDFLFAKSNNQPIVVAAYPVSAIAAGEDALIVATVNPDWMSKIMSNLGGRPGISAVLVDSTGIVLAAPADQASMIGRPLDTIPLLSAIADAAVGSDQAEGSRSFVAADGSKRTVDFVRIAGTDSRLIVSNDRLTVMASIDMLSGLANRRGFQSRLEFEWMKAQQYNCELSLLMIDVDHFKLYNDTYGHPEGDACLARLGEALSEIAAETMGFAGRYGGEEFCLLLPNTASVRAVEIGEAVRAAIQGLAMPHCTSSY